MSTTEDGANQTDPEVIIDPCGRTDLPPKVSRLRMKLNQKAKQQPKFRFYVLYDRIYRHDVLAAAWRRVRKPKTSPGVDGVAFEDIENSPGGVAGFLQLLHDSLRSKSYKPEAVRRVADLQGYFDTIPHDNLLKALAARISDRSVLSLIRMWLQSPIEETDESGQRRRRRPTAGTPQGGVISPLLANLYLHWFEVLFYRHDGPARWAGAELVRYADDFVVLARCQTERLRLWIETTLEGRFGLVINREKTRVVSLGQIGGGGVGFPGFHDAIGA